MTDDLDAKLSASLRRTAGSDFDADSAAASFGVRRAARLRTRRTAGAVGLGVAVALGALAPSIGRNLLGDDASSVGLAAGPSLSASADPEPSDAMTFTAVATPKPTSATYEPSASPAPAPSETVTAETPKSSPSEPAASGKTAPTPSSDDAPYPARNDDDGKNYTIEVNEGIAVLLDGDESFRWSELVISDTSVVYGESGRATDGDQEWKLVGLKPGRVTVSSTQDPACREATPPCGAPSRSWQITIVVTD
jgi:hypothetical protein